MLEVLEDLGWTDGVAWRAEVERLTADRVVSVIFSHREGAPRPFALYRIEDETGVSGTGVVAQGAVFEDGTVALRWLTERRSTAVYASIEDVEAVHGHGGRTRVVWLSEELEPLAEMERQRDEARAEVERLREEVEVWRARARSIGYALDSIRSRDVPLEGEDDVQPPEPRPMGERR